MRIVMTHCCYFQPFAYQLRHSLHVRLGQLLGLKPYILLTYTDINAYSHTFITYIFMNELLIYNAKNGDLIIRETSTRILLIYIRHFGQVSERFSLSLSLSSILCYNACRRRRRRLICPELNSWE